MTLQNTLKLATMIGGVSALALAVSTSLAVAQSDGNDRTPGGVEHAPSPGGGLAPSDEMTTRGMPDLTAPEAPAAAAPAAPAPEAQPAPAPAEAPTAEPEDKKKGE